MGNPLLDAPYIPGGQMPFPREFQPMDPYARLGGDVPVIGIDTPVGRVGICPQGTACTGPTIDVAGVTACFGSFRPFEGRPDLPQIPQLPFNGNGEPQVPGVRPPSPAPCNGACASGYHLNRSDYFLKSGQFVRKESVCVRNRRRNPLNPKAADRAIGRLRSASAFGKYLAKISLPARGTKRR